MDEPIPNHWAEYWRTGKTLYAFVEHRDESPPNSEEPTWLTLDVIRQSDLQRALELVEPSAGTVPTAQVVLAVPRSAADVFTLFTEGTWHPIILSRKRGRHPARLFRDLDGIGIALVYLESVPPMPGEDAHHLSQALSLRDIIEASSFPALAKADFVAVIDVGQGNCNALCDKDGRPLVYFDLGGGCLANAKTYPKSIQFCFALSPDVILSHWDFDHWYSGNLHPRAQAATWYAPDQKIGARTRKFINLLKASGKLKKWPKHATSRTIAGGIFDKCLGSTKNDSGLACLSLLPNDIEVLCPADATFSWLPPKHKSAAILHGLVATHHGSAHTGVPIPSAVTAGHSPIAFSFGAPNTFKHPAATAVTSYTGAGWRQFDTAGGHIALGRPSGATHKGCSCTLKTTQP